MNSECTKPQSKICPFAEWFVKRLCQKWQNGQSNSRGTSFVQEKTAWNGGGSWVHGQSRRVCVNVRVCLARYVESAFRISRGWGVLGGEGGGGVTTHRSARKYNLINTSIDVNVCFSFVSFFALAFHWVFIPLSLPLSSIWKPLEDFISYPSWSAARIDGGQNGGVGRRRGHSEAEAKMSWGRKVETERWREWKKKENEAGSCWNECNWCSWNGKWWLKWNGGG